MKSCQEEKNRCYFVYGHYKSDTNELFYIGIGKKRKGASHSQIYARACQIICTNSNTGQVLKFSSSYKFAKFLGVSSNAHILDVLNNKRSNIKSWEVKHDL